MPAVLAAVCAVVALLAGAAPVGGQSVRSEVVRIGGLREQPDGAYLVIAAPPVSQSGTPLAADDFAVTVGGEEVASEARPRDPADLTVAIVLQAGVSAEDLEVYKNAATETLLALPDVTSAIVISSGTEPKVLAPAGTDRRAASEAIAAVTRAPGATAASALDLAADELGDAPRKVILQFGPVGFATQDEIQTIGSRLVDEQVALYTLGLTAAPAFFEDVVAATGGRTAAVEPGGPAEDLVGLGQSIVTELSSQYLVAFTPAEPLSESSRIGVATRAVARSEAIVPPDLLPGGGIDTAGESEPPPRAPRGETQDDGRDVPWAIVGIAGAAVVLIAGLTMLVLRRRRSRPGPSFGVPTAQAVISPAPAADDVAVADGTGPGSEADAVSETATETEGETEGEPASADPVPEPGFANGHSSRVRPARNVAARAGHVDDALDRLNTFASRWQPRSQGIFFAYEALAIHHRMGVSLSLDELSRSTALAVLDGPVRPVVKTIEALRWSLVRRSQGGRWPDIAVEAAAVLRGEFDPSGETLRAVRSGTPFEHVAPSGHVDRLRGQRVLEDEVQLREPVRAAAIVRERVLEYQWFGAESEVVSRILVPVLLYGRAPAAAPYLSVSSELGETTDMSEYFEAATTAADDATRRVIRLRALRSRYQAELAADVVAVIELLFSVPVVSAGYLAERLDASAAEVTDLMDRLVAAGVVEPVREPTRRGDPAWIAIEVLSVFKHPPASTIISLSTPSSAESEIPDRGTHRRRAAPTRPRQLRARPRP